MKIPNPVVAVCEMLQHLTLIRSKEYTIFKIYLQPIIAYSPSSAHKRDLLPHNGAFRVAPNRSSFPSA